MVNLAGESLARGRWTRKKKEAILGSRLRAGAAVVEAIGAAKEKPAVLVQSSAVGFYGSGGDEELDEGAARGEGFLAAVAGKWEESTAVVESWGVRRVVIRTGLVLDPRGGVLPRLALPFRFYAGGPVGSGRQWFPWISLEDEIRAILFLMDRKDLRGVFNLVSPGILRQRDFSRVLGRALRRPSWLRVPPLILNLAFGEKSRETLLVGQKAAPRRLLEAGFKFRHREAEEALSELLR
jgi:hypothetical protein